MTSRPLFYAPDGQPTDADGYERYRRDLAAHRVGLDTITHDGPGPAIVISTVWLGIDHNFGAAGPPLIYETMTFHAGGSSDDDEPPYPFWDEIRRYPDRDAAELGHAATIARTLRELKAAGHTTSIASGAEGIWEGQ